MRLSSSRILMINRFYFWNISFWTHDNFISCKYCRSTFAEMEARRTICYVLLEIARIPFSLLRDNCVKISFARMDSYVPVRGLLHCENKLFAESAVAALAKSPPFKRRSLRLDFQNAAGILTRCTASQTSLRPCLPRILTNMRHVTSHLQFNLLSPKWSWMHFSNFIHSSLLIYESCMHLTIYLHINIDNYYYIPCVFLFIILIDF